MPDLLPASSAAPLRLRTPGDLVAAVPVLLGFRPRESLVLIATGSRSGGRVGLTLRVDLPPPEHAAEVAATVVDALAADEPAGAVGLVVAAPGPLGVPPARGLVDLVAAGLGERGIAADTLLWASGTRAGDRWRCYPACGCAGTVPDPASSVAMARFVADGGVVAEDRADLARRLEPDDPAAIARREALLAPGSDAAGAACDAPVPDPTAVLDDAAGHVDRAVADALAGRLVLDDDRVVGLAIALGTPEGREAAVRNCLGPHPRVVEELWAALARGTPEPEAAEPAALLALAALLRGDGALAAVALDRAEEGWPGHRLARLLAGVLAARVRPSELRAWLVRSDRARG